MIHILPTARGRNAQRKRTAVAKKKESPKRSLGGKKGLEGFQIRGYIVSFVLVAVFGWLSFNMAMIGVMPVNEPTRKPVDVSANPPMRGNIYDVNGQLLATTIEVRSLYADPKAVMDINEAVAKLSSVLPHLSEQKLHKELSRKGRFVWLARKLTPKQVADVNMLGLPGVNFRKEAVRFYPQKNIMAHVIGGINREGDGISGVEKAYNYELQHGQDITLTLDLRLQSQMRDSLQAKLKESGSKGASAVVMSPKTGAVMAMVSLPDYDPNHYGGAKPASWQNRATYSLYELGSTFKTFTVAEGLEEEKITPLTKLDCRKPLEIDKFKIRDSHAKKKVMTATEVYRYSSNIGAARIADMFDEGAQRQFYRKLNLLEPLNISLNERGSSIYPDRDGRIYTLTMAFGHGIAVTPLHVAAAVGTLVSDGQYKTPYFVQGEQPEKGEQVVSMNTVKVMRNLMRDVVRNGTGRKAHVVGYDIGGKTGTAEKNVGGKYVRDKNISSFVGVLPLSDPEMLVSIVFDEGKIDGESGGGRVAAPVFAEFVRKAAPVIGMLPQQHQFAKTEIIKKEVKKPVEPVYNKHQINAPSGAELDEIFRLVATAE